MPSSIRCSPLEHVRIRRRAREVTSGALTTLSVGVIIVFLLYRHSGLSNDFARSPCAMATRLCQEDGSSLVDKRGALTGEL